MPAPVTDDVERQLDTLLGVKPSPGGKPLPGVIPNGGAGRPLDAGGEPSPEPSPSPSPSASPDDLIGLVQQAVPDIQQTRIATTNGFFGLGVVIMFLFVIVLQNAFRRNGK